VTTVTDPRTPTLRQAVTAKRVAAVALVLTVAVVTVAASAVGGLFGSGAARPPAAAHRAAAPPGGAATGTTRCTKLAAPRGLDSWSGSLRRPYRSVQQLVDSLAPGDTGCLRRGVYVHDEVTVRVPGVRLTSYRGERARLVGRLRVMADRVVVEGLVLDGRNARTLPSPTINGDAVVFRGNDMSSPGDRSCFLLGSEGEVRQPLLTRNRIHDCGNPATLSGHGIYMQQVDGARIVGNLIYDNGDRGIKVGPDAHHSTIRGNVIDGNPIGLNFSGDGHHASSHNVVERNVIANSTRWWNVQSYWPRHVVGHGNDVRSNCVYAGHRKPPYQRHGGLSAERGFTAHDNLVAEPRYVDRKGENFALRSDSPCRAVFRP
jgi:hypothetical protein